MGRHITKAAERAVPDSTRCQTRPPLRGSVKWTSPPTRLCRLAVSRSGLRLLARQTDHVTRADFDSVRPVRARRRRHPQHGHLTWNAGSESGKSDVRGIRRLPPTRQACSIFSADTVRLDPPRRASTTPRFDSNKTRKGDTFPITTLPRPSKPVRYTVAIKSHALRTASDRPLGQARSIDRHSSNWTKPHWRFAPRRASPPGYATSTPHHPKERIAAHTLLAEHPIHRELFTHSAPSGQARSILSIRSARSLSETPHRPGKPVRYRVSDQLGSRFRSGPSCTDLYNWPSVRTEALSGRPVERLGADWTWVKSIR